MRQRKKPSNKAQSHLDHDLRKKRKSIKKLDQLGSSRIKKATSSSKSGLRGTDGVDYSGSNRRLLNIGKLNKAVSSHRKKKVDKEQAKRTAKRTRLSKNIIGRQKRKKGY